MPEKNDQATAPDAGIHASPAEPTQEVPRADPTERKEGAAKAEDTSVLPDPGEEGSGLEEIDDSLVRVENS